MVTADNEWCAPCSRPWEGNHRFFPDASRNENNLQSPPEARSSPPITVARALREYCNIPFESFFLAAGLGDGRFAYFSGPNPIPEEDILKVFRRDKFMQFQKGASLRDIGDGVAEGHEDERGTDVHHSICPSLPVEDHWPAEPSRRKRPRKQGMMRRQLDDVAPPVVMNSKKALTIGDSEAVLNFYDRGFKCIQQTACKEVAKAFVKIIAPKKQANFPYVKGDAAAPDWWPKPWGPGEKDRARHVEPDHMWKKERVHLLKHILRLIIDPETQPPSIRKLGTIPVARLEAAAMDSLAEFFADPNKPKNAKKKPILKELFRVAKMEERYKRNEIDGSTQVIVTADDMVMNHCFDPDEEEDEEEEVESGTTSSAMSHVSPTRAAALPLLPPLSSPPGNSAHALGGQFQPTPFLSDLTIRANQYGEPPMLPSPDVSADQYAAYSDSHNLAAAAQTTAAMQMQDMLAGAGPHHQHQDPNRRPSAIFTPPTSVEFSSLPMSMPPLMIQPSSYPATAASGGTVEQQQYHQHHQHHSHAAAAAAASASFDSLGRQRHHPHPHPHSHLHHQAQQHQRSPQGNQQQQQQQAAFRSGNMQLSLQ
ncbi:hypothetical protein VTH06DRAFT_3421 [Thermothelomyces fergusii]